jgi:MoaA/NifB/PqqE/SkfB family radical SAM enzyme
LIEDGLDVLWVSIDGATPESYADVRLGAALPDVLSNITQFNNSRSYSDYFTSYEVKPQIGIVFVAMKRNIADLPSVLRLGNRLGAARFLITNVLPYSPEMREEILYSQALAGVFYLPSLYSTELPKIDLNDTTREALFKPMHSGYRMKFAGSHFEEASDWCPFIEKGATAVSWNGDVSPCLPLLHNHVSYLNGLERHTRRYLIGNVNEREFRDLWNLPEYVAFRGRVQEFDFSFCTLCGGCDLSERNEEDCFGNTFPTCGGCLWAQGIIRCP